MLESEGEGDYFEESGPMDNAHSQQSVEEDQDQDGNADAGSKGKKPQRKSKTKQVKKTEEDDFFRESLRSIEWYIVNHVWTWTWTSRANPVHVDIYQSVWIWNGVWTYQLNVSRSTQLKIYNSIQKMPFLSKKLTLFRMANSFYDWQQLLMLIFSFSHGKVLLYVLKIEN